MGRFTLSRREVLKGIFAGSLVSVALPPLEAMLNSTATAFAGGAPFPVRFMTLCFGNGYIKDRWIPDQAVSGAQPTWTLSEELAPLVNVKDYINVPTGFDIKLFDRITHHEGMAGMFSGYPFTQQAGLYSKFGGPSVDQVVAAEIGGDTFLSSMELGVSKRVSTDEGPTMQFMSHKDTEQPMPPTYNPRTAFATLFGGFQPPDENQRLSRINVLDAVLEDAKSLKNRVGLLDRQRIDAHLESIYGLQEQINQIPPVCGNPAEPSETNQDAGGIEPLNNVATAMIDLLVIAFSCDIVRVSSMMLTGGVGHTVFSEAPLAHNTEQHYMSHAPVTYATELNESIIWNVSRFAELCEKLMAVTEGTGNLLDNSVLMLTSDVSNGSFHDIDDMPIIIGGRGGGAIRYPGEHYRAAGDNTTDILLACAKAAAPAITSIGGAEGQSTTPHPSLYVGP